MIGVPAGAAQWKSGDERAETRAELVGAVGLVEAGLGALVEQNKQRG